MSVAHDQLKRYVPAWVRSIEDSEDIVSEAWLSLYLSGAETEKYKAKTVVSKALDQVVSERNN